MKKEYKAIKKTDDYGEVKTIALVLSATNEIGKTVLLKAMRVIGDDERENVSSMADTELAAYAQRILDATYSEQDIESVFNAHSISSQLQGA